MMSVNVSQFDCQHYPTTKPTRKRIEARFEVRESKAINHINTKTINQGQPAETPADTSKTKPALKTSEKTIRFTKGGYIASACIQHGGQRKQEHVSSTIHYVGKRKSSRTIQGTNNRFVSSKDLTGAEQNYEMSECGNTQIPSMPIDEQDDQSSQKNQRNALKLTPGSSKSFSREQNNNICVSLSTEIQRIRTEPVSNIIVTTQSTCKQTHSPCVKGQSGLNIQRNADTKCYVSANTDRCDAYREKKSRTDHENIQHNYPSTEPQQTSQINHLIVRTKPHKTENTNTECVTTAMSQLNKQEHFSRQTHYKHTSLGSTSEASITYTDSGSDHVDLSSSSEGEECSAGLPRTNSTKRRKRVKRKGSSKSIDSSMYGDDNTTDGESANDTLSRVHDRRTRKKDDEIALNSTSHISSRSKSTNAIKGAHFRSSSLTSVSSGESGKLASAISSPLLAPRGPTLVKKIQIQSFSSSYTGFKKDNKENVPKRRASSEEHFSTRIRERSLVPDHPRSSKNNPNNSNNGRTATPPSRGRPFALRSKPFQLKRSSSRESPCTSDAESLSGTPLTSRVKDDSIDTAIPVFTDKPNQNIPRVSPESHSLASNLSTDSHYTSIDDEVFSGNLDISYTNDPNNRVEQLPVFKSDLEDIPVTFIETTQASAVVSDSIAIPSSTDSDSDQWMAHSYPPRSHTYGDDSFGHYGYKALSIVNENDEIDFTQPPVTTDIGHTRHTKTSTTSKPFIPSSSDKWNLDLESETNGNNGNNYERPPASPVRRPSYLKAQQNVDDFTMSLFHSLDDEVSKPAHTTDSGTEDEFTEDYDPKKVLRSFSGSNIAESVQRGGDLITFDDEHMMEISNVETSEEPVVKKRKKKIARPKIPTIFSIDGKELAIGEDGHIHDKRSSKEHAGVGARQETLGQDSMDEKCSVGVSKDEEFDMIEGSKRNTLVAIDSDDGSTPKAPHSPDPENYLNKEMKTIDEPSKNTGFSLPEIITDLYVENDENIEDPNISLKKVDTIFDLSGDESPTICYQEYQNNRSIESLASRSEGESPNNSEMNLDKYSMTTSGFSEIGGELTDSGEIPTQEPHTLTAGKNEAWRSQSDPCGRGNGAGAPLSETIAEAAELTNYRTSNSTPNLITEKIKKEEKLLAERSKRLERPAITRTKSSPSSMPKKTLDDIDKVRSNSLGSKDDSHAKLSTDSLDVLSKSSQRVHSAPSTPTQTRKQHFPGTFTAEKTQMKLAKLAVAAMEPIYETPLTEVVRPLPEPVKLERKVGTSPIPVIEERERPPATGLQDSQPAMESLQPKASPKSKHDIKRHVVQNLLDTEQSYVQNLQFIISAYYKPLKKPENAHIVDPAQVDEMFYQISDILLCHEFFLEQLEGRVNDWHDKQKIGDILVASFTKCFLMDAYSAFISHFLHARAAVRIATVSRPAFQRFIEQCCREHKEKYTLQDLMIIPVQRIPRYVLILKDMIKHTAPDHPDYGSLLLALGEIKTLADRMNRGEKEVNEAEIEADRLRDIEASIEGITDLVLSNRRFLRKDLAAEVRGSITKKDRCLFLFNDLLCCASVKRKPNALRRGSLSLFSGQSGSEFNKHKLLWKISLENVELVKSSPEMQRRNSLEKELEKLENDMSVLSQISSLTDSLNVGHQALDSSIREMMNEVSRQIADKQIPMHQSLNTKIELQLQTEDGLESFVFLFLDVEIKNTWEAYFENAKQKLAYAKDTFPPEFQYPIPITKTRSGMQFTCSSPSQVPHMLDRGNHCGSGDVWVCTSDGYVGQVCILSIGGQIQPVASLSVCSSRILCISPVPGTKLVGLETVEHDSKSDTRSLGNNSDTSYKVSSSQKLSPGYSSDDDRTAQSIMAFDSSSDEEEGNDGFIDSKFGRNSPIFDGRLSPEGSSLGTIDGEMDSSNDEEEESEIDEEESEEEESKVKASPRHSKRRDSALTTGSATSAEDKLSLSDIVQYETEEGSTVWLGTEDGSIFVYPVTDGHQKKNKMKIQHQASVQCVLYVDNQVFVSLGNGDLCIYRRQPGSAWEVGAPITLHVGSSAPVSCMTAVHGRLWCGCQCNAIIYNTTTLKIETQFNCSSDKDRSVYRMVSTGMGVWLSLQSSAVIKLFHATRYECLADVDVAPPVHKMLAGSDAIIRQHKAACLRVTSLLTCKDLLWIGTSAGVVLTLPLPTITATTSSLRNSPSATASYHGHTGHVRFLTAVEVPKDGAQENTNDKETSTPMNNSAPNSGHSLTRGGPTGTNVARDILIISGGDGYEDFKTSSTSESAGRDDSTNHLLIWRV